MTYLKIKRKLIASAMIAIVLALGSPATSLCQTSTVSSIKLPSGETVTGRQIQNVLNKCSSLADYTIKTDELLKATEEQNALLRDENANLKSQIVIYQSTTAAYEKAVTAYQMALVSEKESKAARDEEIKVLKDRVKTLEGRKSHLWQKILLGVAVIAITRSL